MCPSPHPCAACIFCCPTTHTLCRSICAAVKQLKSTQPAVPPAACAHPCSSYYIMLADLPVASCYEPDQGPSPAKNNPMGGVEVASSTSRADWKHMQNHSFRVRFQSNLNAFKFWLPQSHLARKSPPPQDSRHSCEICSQPLQRPEVTANPGMQISSANRD